MSLIASQKSFDLIHGSFEAQARQHPRLTAIRNENFSLSYGELNGRANRLARLLRQHEVGPETVVGIQLGRCADAVVCILAVLKAGAAILPLDPAQPAGRRAAIARDAGARIVLTEPESVDECSLPAGAVLTTKTAFAQCAAFSADDIDSGATPGNVAYVAYTSGSTGTSKGISGLHAGMANYISWLVKEFPAGLGEVAAQRAPLIFLDAVWEIFLPLSMGCTLAIAPELVVRDPALLNDFLAAHSASRLVVVPSLLRALIGWALSADTSAGLAGVKVWFCSGEELPAATVRAFRDWLPAARLVNLYGMSEASAVSTWHDFRGSGDDTWDGARVPIGKPVPGTSVRIMRGTSASTAVGPGQVGEICIAGIGLARGYVGQPGRTAECFLPDPWSDSPGSRMYRTGDLGLAHEDGTIYYHGRADQQVKIRGARIELGEAESAIAGHPLVRTVAVVAAAAPGGETRLAAYYAGDGSLPRPAELRAFLSHRLPAHMIPGTFTPVSQLPLTASGKLDRARLLDPAEHPHSRVNRYSAPGSAQEWLMADVWADVLGVNDVGRLDDFVELGGDSLTAMRVSSELLRLTGVRVPSRALFEVGTVAGLAPLLGQSGVLAASPSHTAPPADGGSGRPSAYEEWMWIIERTGLATAVYSIPTATRFSGPFDPDAARAAFTGLLERHVVLRSRFPAGPGGQPIRVTGGPVADFAVREVAAGRVLDVAAELARVPFDLERGPLLRVRVLRVSAEQHVLVVVVHHIVFDGWSEKVLWREFAELYRSHVAGTAPGLPPLPVQYADYAQWQAERLTGARLAELTGYWRGQLAGVPVLELPADRPRPPVQAHRGAEHRFAVPDALAGRLRDSPAAGIPPRLACCWRRFVCCLAVTRARPTSPSASR